MRADSVSLRFGRVPRKLPEQRNYDVIIGGAGANGSAIFRELSLRGASVLLLDQPNPHRPSRTNSHMMHGGLRYLENFEFKLVWEAREAIVNWLKTAKHLVHPMRFLLPIYQRSKETPWTPKTSPFAVKQGLRAYDLFSHHSPLLPSHKTLDATGELPEITEEGLLKTFEYHDSQIAYPDRLAIETIRDGIEQAENPAAYLPHTEITHISESADGKHVQVVFADHLNGDRPVHVTGRYFINAAGPQVDSLRDREKIKADKQRGKLMGPTKGTHILVNNVLKLDRAVYMQAKDGRPYFVLPYPVRGDDQPADYLLIGTTDDKPKPGLSPYPVRNEVDYLLSSTNARFKSGQIAFSDVFQAFSGFRPLPGSRKKTNGKIPRSHSLEWNHPKGHILYVIGGKLTTQQSLAKEAADRLVKPLKLSKQSITMETPLPGSRFVGDFDFFHKAGLAEITSRYGLEEAVASQLLHRYGALYKEVLGPVEAYPLLKEPLAPEVPYIAAQVLYALQHDYAETLTDVMTTALQLDNYPLSPAALETVLRKVAGIVARMKDLNLTEAQQEVETYLDYWRRNNQWRSEPEGPFRVSLTSADLETFAALPQEQVP